MSELSSLVMGHCPRSHHRQAEGSDMVKALRISAKEVFLLPVLADLT